jgi:chromosomal replication initiator protein
VLEADLHLIAGLFSLPLIPADVPNVAARAGGGDLLTPTRRTSEGNASPSAEQFIAGPENVLVRTLADAATSDPLTYNPLVLCGAIGVGKTSLAHALAARRRERLQLTSVIATTGADLVRALAHSIETDGVADFRARHHQCDLLLIDDVHQLAGKAAAQQFLLTLLDVLTERGALIIATLRQLPQLTDGLTPALASRLAGGLVAPIAPPGSLARRALVRQVASRARLSITDDDVDRLVGDDDRLRRFASPAQLRHAVLQLAAVSATPPLTTADPLAVKAIDARLVCKQAAIAVAKHSGLTLTELRGKSRRQVIADARGLAMYLSRRLSGASYAEIGRHFGHRDHTTVLHACKKLASLVTSDNATRRLAADLETRIASESL